MSEQQPEELTILENLQRILEETVIEGADNQSGGKFFNTLLGKVHVGRTIFDESDGLPLVSILEVPLPDEQRLPSIRGGFGNLSGKWDLVVQGWAPDDRSPDCLLYTSPSPRDQRGSRMPSSA